MKIEKIADIKKIKLGDQYYIDGPEDPIDYFDTVQKLRVEVDKHISDLIEAEKKNKNKNKNAKNSSRESK